MFSQWTMLLGALLEGYKPRLQHSHDSITWICGVCFETRRFLVTIARRKRYTIITLACSVADPTSKDQTLHV